MTRTNTIPVAVVTGASSGNGRAIARRLAQDGFAVACADLSPRPVTGTSTQDATHEVITAEGGTALFVQADVGDGDQVISLYQRTLAELGRLDVVVANAGISPQPPVHLPEESYDTYRQVMKVNADGAWWTCREGSRILREHGGGRIILVSSIAGLVGTDSGAHYCMSKGAVNQLTRALALQMAPAGITVNAICPGFVRTAMTADYLADPNRLAAVLAAHPLGRVGETDDIAAAVSFLAGPGASWITGALLPVDGGYSAI